MGKAKIVMMMLFVLTLSSGLVAGMLVSRIPVKASDKSAPRSPLAEVLKLTDEQNEKMRKIWEGARNNVDECFQKAQDIQKNRDASVMAMLSEEQKAKFAKIQQDTADALSALKNQRDTMFQQAVSETKRILSNEQKDKYEEILQRRLGHGPGAGSPDWIAPASLPASQPGGGH
jgi:Na+-transporting NADH:ubiquinone oxidoreductase subunit NqrC